MIPRSIQLVAGRAGQEYNIRKNRKGPSGKIGIEKLEQNDSNRETEWTENIGVGSRSFLQTVKEKLGYRARDRSVIERIGPGTYQLRETQAVYASSNQEGGNRYHWDV